MTEGAAIASVMVFLDRSSRAPLHSQLYGALRGDILRGRLKGGARLPSTRDLAAELGVSRNTVMNAYLHLQAEGYTEGKVGSGTYVAGSLPDGLLRVRPGSPGSAPSTWVDGRPPGRRISSRGQILAATPPIATARGGGRPLAFRPCVPALDAVPRREWKRLSARRWRLPPDGLLGYGDPAGYRPLREAIAGRLGAARAVRCSWEQVVVVSGSQQALDLSARVLLDPGDEAWVEDPGYAGARAALVGAGARIVPVRVDGEGLDVAAGETTSPEARLACVTPSHQYPLGSTMSLRRRLALLEWAGRSGAWVLEDDYDSEYRYSGRPLEALQGLDAAGSVVYVGTFSKVLFPGLRLGYLVVPPDLVDAFVAAREITDRHPPGVEQAVLADFIGEGHFSRHVRRMRALYAERRGALLEAAERELRGLLDVKPAEAGMHLVGFLPEGEDDREASRRAASRGVEAPPVSAFSLGPPEEGGLVLGYAAFDKPEIDEGAKALADALERTPPGSGARLARSARGPGFAARNVPSAERSVPAKARKSREGP